MLTVNVLQTPEPHHLPGYTGYCPQSKYNLGESYGKLSHRLLLSDSWPVEVTNKNILPEVGPAFEIRPTDSEIEVLNSRKDKVVAVWNYPILPSYTGHIPFLGIASNKPRGVNAAIALAAFEKYKVENMKPKFEYVHSSVFDPENMQNCLYSKSEHKFPHHVVRPDLYTDFKQNEKLPQKEKLKRPRDYLSSPYFTTHSETEKYLKTGFTGYSPYRAKYIGKTFKEMSASGLKDFTAEYLKRRKDEWKPVLPIKTPDPPLALQEIHKKGEALIPSYTGYIPGAKFRLGKTRGYCSKKAREYLDEMRDEYETMNG